MSYLALYREFRPTGFDSLIGQEHVVKTLINQIKTGRIGHAYLFCGARGTGKTTAAKIFARAINCLSPVNGSPCGECEVCKKLANPSNLDIVEMDAASNNKVENVRDLRDKVQYPPVAGRYKVYIVDEVHMLTAEAFNALLKTLEEPPEHAVFILATTEVQKLPSTILSRCLRFDFKLIPTEKIAANIAAIYDKIGKKYQKEAIDLIARAGEGSMRDALSVADVCVSYSDGVLTYDDVLEVLGASDRGEIEKFVECVLCGDSGGVLSRLESLCKRGKSVGVLNRDVCSVLRDLLIVKTCENAKDLLGLPDDKFDEFKKIALKGDSHGILRAIEIFSAAESDLKYSTHPRIVFETAALKASMPENDYNIDALISRINALESRVKSLAESGVTVGRETAESKGGANGYAEKTDLLKAADSNVRKTSGEMQKEQYEAKAAGKPQAASESAYRGDEYIPEPPPADENYYNDAVVSPPEGPIDTAFGYPPVDVDNPREKNEPELKKSAYKPVNGTFAQESGVSVNGGGSAYFNSEANLNKKMPDAGGALESDTRKAWGAILKRLREDKEIMLWVACQDVGVKTANGKFFVVASGKSEYNLLTKPANLKKLGEYVSAEYGGELIIVDDAAKVEEESKSSKSAGAVANANNSDSVDFAADGISDDKLEEKQVKAVKDFFGENNVEVSE